MSQQAANAARALAISAIFPALSAPRPDLRSGLDQAPRLGLDPAPERSERFRPTVPDFWAVTERIGLHSAGGEPAPDFGVGGADFGREYCRLNRHGGQIARGEAR